MTPSTDRKENLKALVEKSQKFARVAVSLSARPPGNSQIWNHYIKLRGLQANIGILLDRLEQDHEKPEEPNPDDNPS